MTMTCSSDESAPRWRSRLPAQAKREQRVLPVAQGFAVDDLAPQGPSETMQTPIEELNELLLGAHGLERLQIVQRVGQQADQFLGELRLRPTRLFARPTRKWTAPPVPARSAIDASASFQETRESQDQHDDGLTASATNCAASW